ncbi:MAG: hypothetical protein H0T85_03915 [Geodermatophilaceae bacterium]|nr:hypothetical protein [Geodermatophilaceae bacterium]
MAHGDPAHENLPPARWVELRVHGVSGTPPQDMLGSAHVVQVAGDELSSFYRPADSTGHERSGEHVLEAYHWGKYTSGSWRQGLWLALLPFGLVNAAQFMLPRPGPAPSVALLSDWSAAATPRVLSAGRWHSAAGAMLRLAGIALTCLLLLSVAVVLLDLTAWQWAPRHPGLAWDPLPGWPIAAALVLSVGVLVGLASFGRERRPHGRASAPEDRQGAPDVPPTDLGRASFFRGDPDAPQLRRLHLASGTTLLAVLAFDVGDLPGWPERWGHRLSIGWLCLLIGVVVVLGDPERGARGFAVGRSARWRTVWHERVLPATTPPALIVSAALFLVAVALRATEPHSRADAARAVPGVDGMAFAVLLVCVLAMTGLFVSCAVLAVRTRPPAAEAPPPRFGRFAGGMTAALVTSLGMFLGVGYAAAICFGWASLLNRGADAAVEVPPLLQRVAYAWGLTVFLFVAMAVAAVVWLLSRQRGFEGRVRAAYTFGERTACRLPERWVPRVARAMLAARLKNFLQPTVWTLSLFGVVLSVAAGIGYARSRGAELGCPADADPGPMSALSRPQDCGSAGVVITIGTFALLGLAGLLLLLGRGALRRAALRRGVNVVWDVIAFWPRAVHPFVPPPYSMLAVEDLRQRIRWHLGTHESIPNPEPAPHLVLAAHSQGSLIAVSALLWLDAAERARVGLVSFGSQLQVEFSRAFPAYVDIGVLRWLWTAYGGRWVNLYRDTDAIAGPVLSWSHSPDQIGVVGTSERLDSPGGPQPDGLDPATGRRICGPEWRLLDPSPSEPELQTGPVAKVLGHSEYWADPDWAKALAAACPAVAD